MSSGDFSNLVIRRATAYNPDGSFIKDGYVFTVGANGKQSWASDLKLNNLVISTVTLNSQLYVASSIFDRAAVSTLNVSTLSASSMNVSRIVIKDAVTCTLAASTLLFPSVTFDSIGASSMIANTFVGTDMTVSTLRTTNLSATNFTFVTLAGSTLTGNNMVVQSTLASSTISSANMGFTNGTGSTLTTNSLTVLSTILGSSLTVSSVTSGSVSGVTIQGSTFSVNAAIVQSTLSASTLLTTNLTAAAINASVVTYSTLIGSTLRAGSVVITSTMTGSTVNAANISYSTLTGDTMVGSSVSAVNVSYSTLTGSTLAMNTGFWNSTLIGSTLNMINATYSTLQGSTLSANTVVWNSTLIGSTLNAIYVTYSTIQGSTLIANNVTVQSTLTASTVNAINVSYSTLAGSTLSVNTVVIQSTLTVSSVAVSTLSASTIGVTGVITGSIRFSTMTGSSMMANTLAVGSTLTASSLNTVNMSYSTLQGGAIQSQSMIASTLTGSTINFANLTFSTLLASTMTANVMFPLSLQGSTMNVSNLLTATNVGIGTTATAYPLTVSNSAFSAVELNRISTTTNNFYASGTVHTVTDPTGGFKGKYAYAFGGAKTLATTSQSQALGYYAIDVAATNGIFGSDTANGASGAMFYMDSIKTYFQNTALGVGTTSPSWPLTVAKDLSFAAMTSNPLDAALVITGKTNSGTLKIGTYYTGASFGAAIQSSQFSGSDTVGALILNPLGGNVGIGTVTPGYTLHIIGSTYSSGIIGAPAYYGGDQRSVTNYFKPISQPAGTFTVGFYGNAGGSSGWGDGIHFNTYADGTGGSQNLVLFQKSAIGMRIYQGTFGSSTSYSTFLDCCMKTSGAESLTSFTATAYATNPTLFVGCKTGQTNMYGLNQAGIIVTDGNLHIDATRRTGNASSGIYYGFYANQDGAANNHQFYGNVGIGTAPGYVLDLYGSNPTLRIRTSAGAYTAGTATLLFDSITGSYPFAKIVGEDTGTSGLTYRGDLVFYTQFNTALSERMRIKNDGNITISGTIAIGGNPLYNNGINLPTGGWGIHWGAGYSRIVDDSDLRICTDDNIHFNTGSTNTSLGTERMVILAGGNVGIGITNPSTALHVNGTITATAFSGAFSGNATSATSATYTASNSTTSIEARLAALEAFMNNTAMKKDTNYYMYDTYFGQDVGIGSQRHLADANWSPDSGYGGVGFRFRST